MSKKNIEKVDEDDPYSKLLSEEDNKLKIPEKESARARKMRLLRGKSSELWANFQNGFIIGSLVGGSFGTIIGLWTAVQHRSLLMIPLSAIISAASFGFFLGVGSIIRSDDLEKGYVDMRVRIRDANGEILLYGEDFWMMKDRFVNGKF